MNRIIRLAAVAALGLSVVAPASASPTRDEACRTSIANGLHWGGRPVSAPGQTYLGSVPADMGPALAAPSLQARFYQYCLQGGRMDYWPYAHTFLRTNGFYLFGETADAAAVRMLREDSQRGAGPLSSADHRQTAPEGALQVAETTRAETRRAEARVLWPGVSRTRTYTYGDRGDRMRLPDMAEGSLYFEVSGANAFVTHGRDAMIYTQSTWYRLPAADR
jgi:hypothetical protein